MLLTPQKHLLLSSGLGTCLLGSLGLLTSLLTLGHSLDDTDSDGLTHVTDGETTERRVVRESLNAHGLGGDEVNDSSVTRLDSLWSDLDGFSSTSVDLLEDLSELASNVSSVAVQDWGVSVVDLTGVVENDDLGLEGV